MNRVKMSYERKLSLLFKSLFLFGLMMLPSFVSSAWAQSVSLSISSIERLEEKGFVVKGTVTASGMNPKGQIVESDRVSVNVDIKKEPGSVYQELPESMYIRKPAGCESSYTKGKKCMTLKQERGVDILVHGIAGMSMRNEPVWRAYGGLGEWHKNAPASVTKAFEGVIPFNIIHKGKQVQIEGNQLRIRATLRHELGGPYANWPAFSYHHNIAFEGVLPYVMDGPSAQFDKPKPGILHYNPSLPPIVPGNDITL